MVVVVGLGGLSSLLLLLETREMGSVEGCCSTNAKRGLLSSAAAMVISCARVVFRGELSILPEPLASRPLLRAERAIHRVRAVQRGTRRGLRLLLLLGRSDLLAGHLDEIWLRVYTSGAGDVERIGSRTK